MPPSSDAERPSPPGIEEGGAGLAWAAPGSTETAAHAPGAPGAGAGLAPSPVSSPVALVRPRNLVMAAAGVAVGGFLALGAARIPATLAWAMGSMMGLCAAGNASNDYFDVEADRINRPLRPLVTGAVTPRTALLVAGVAGGLGLWAAWWVSGTLLALGAAVMVVILAYSPVLKPRGLPGNLAVAVVASTPLIFGAAAVGHWRAGLVAAVLAAFLHLAREVVKDLEDVSGDLVIGRRTVPIAFGIEAAFALAAAILVVFIPVSLAPWASGWYGWRYGLLVTLLDVGLIVVIVRLSRQRLDGARAALKAAMVLGLVALLWDRL